MALTARELESIVEAFLTEGVPAGVVARVFELDDDVVAAVQRDLRVKRYGTDDLIEYTVQMEWDAIDQARDLLMNGSAAEKTRFIASILGRQMTAAAKRAPESHERMREQMNEIFSEMRTGDATGEREPSRFIARIDDEDDDDAES